MFCCAVYVNYFVYMYICWECIYFDRYLCLVKETSGGGVVPTEVRNPRLQGGTKPQQRVGGVPGGFWDPAVLSPRLSGKGVDRGQQWQVCVVTSKRQVSIDICSGLMEG